MQHVLTHGIQLKAERTSNIFLEMKRLKQTLISKVGEPKIEAHSTVIENPVISNLSDSQLAIKTICVKKGRLS